MIKVEKMYKTYRASQVKAIENMSFAVDNDYVYGILGPKNSGKTTIIKCVTGISSITKGKVEICGHNVRRHARVPKYKMAWMFTDQKLFGVMTGRQYFNTVAGMFAIDQKECDCKREEYVKMFGLTDVIDVKLANYTRSMKQKLIFISGLLHEPKVWIIDEPFYHMEPEYCELIKKYIKQHADNGNAALVSSNRIDVLESMCDRILVLNKGKIIDEVNLEGLKRMREMEEYKEYFRILEEEAEAEKILMEKEMKDEALAFEKRRQEEREFFIKQMEEDLASFGEEQ